MINDNRLVVLDVNVLAFSRPEDWLLPTDHVLLPHAMAYEIATSDKGPRISQGFAPWYRQHSKTIWVAHDAGELIDMEHNPTSSVSGEEYIDHPLTDALRIASQNPEEITFRLHEIPKSEIGHQYAQGKQDFVNLCLGFRQNLRRDRPDDWEKIKAEGRDLGKMVVKMVQDPEAIVRMTRKDTPSLKKYKTADWEQALTIFPDKMAIGRWLRVLYWYTIISAGKSDKEVEKGNDFDDAHYAFLSSYSGFIATRDQGLKDCISALFPSCQTLLQRGGSGVKQGRS